ncbi:MULTISPECIES: hypothetical protein [Stenotrophomonas]|uniref:hypothetical protein n=1 Tax=Stenotrophomonas TaxID=40323 RepID=UPI001660E816|nr:MULTISPECIES: hypothetical protein [Stenotrophomonas]MCU1120763.1 hypothetical protein [Stenotrophomonas maltophilia]MDQ7283587.1 hypothetical protein [Stenotrophomonas sp. Sm5341]
MDDQRHCQHIAHANTDAETEPEHLEVHAFGVQAAARPGVEQITGHGQQRERQQARNEELQFISAITHAMGMGSRFRYRVMPGYRCRLGSWSRFVHWAFIR